LGSAAATASRRVLGKKPTTLENLEEFVRVFRALNGGKSVKLDGVDTRFPLAGGWRATGVVAGYGPKALRTAGRIGDGVILQLPIPISSNGALASSAKALERLGAIPQKSR